jgi:large subunit ribosomal protein L22
MESKAILKYARITPLKARRVIDLIRGKKAADAVVFLRHMPYRGAHFVEKVLKSAIANAQQKDGFGGDVERLFVKGCFAGQGPSQKRVRPAPMGRAYRVVKRTAHLTVEVAERPAARLSAPKAKGGAKAAGAN